MIAYLLFVYTGMTTPSATKSLHNINKPYNTSPSVRPNGGDEISIPRKDGGDEDNKSISDGNTTTTISDSDFLIPPGIMRPRSLKEQVSTMMCYVTQLVVILC